MDVDNFVDAVNAEAEGGNGGNENDDFTSQRCYGEGGGGSGGVVYLNNTIPAGTITVTGGSKGNRQNSLNCAAIVAASNGTNGSTVQNYNFVQSSVLSTYCGVALASGLQKFTVRPEGHSAVLNWEIITTEDLELVIERKKEDGQWSVVQFFTITPSNRNYAYSDKGLTSSVYQYRLKWREKNGAEKYSDVRSVTVGNATPVLFPNPATDFITLVYPFRRGTDLKIYNSTGQSVLKVYFDQDQGFFRYNISSLPSGVYYADFDTHKVRFSVY
jgi:hypothetical protein